MNVRDAARSIRARIDASDTLIWLGIALVSAGAALVYVPAGLIVAGALLIATGWLYGAAPAEPPSTPDPGAPAPGGA